MLYVGLILPLRAHCPCVYSSYSKLEKHISRMHQLTDPGGNGYDQPDQVELTATLALEITAFRGNLIQV